MSRLRQQHKVVEHKVLEVERARLALVQAQMRLVTQVRRRLASPQVLLIAFGAGFAWGAARPTRRVSRSTSAGKLLVAATWLARQLYALRKAEPPRTRS